MTVAVKETIAKLRAVKTMPELDAMRLRVVAVMQSGGEAVFDEVQGEFRKAKNRLRRIPLSERGW